jgi:hypothetical protein
MMSACVMSSEHPRGSVPMGSYAPSKEAVVVVSTYSLPSISVVETAARVCPSPSPSAIANTTSRNDAVPKVMQFPKQAHP